jgi:hypothetical protein
MENSPPVIAQRFPAAIFTAQGYTPSKRIHMASVRHIGSMTPPWRVHDSGTVSGWSSTWRSGNGPSPAGSG